MIKATIFTIAAATTISHSVTDAFNTARKSADDVVNVYAAAGHVLDIDYSTGTINPASEQALYRAASRLEHIAAYSTSAQLPTF
jgi:hypothetical protein